MRTVVGSASNLYRHGLCRVDGKRRPEYKIWDGMMQRCFNPRSPAFKNYGARGITVCERWHDFVNFYADVGDRPPGLTFDRIDNDGNYEPANWRWATTADQNRNKRPAPRDGATGRFTSHELALG